MVPHKPSTQHPDKCHEFLAHPIMGSPYLVLARVVEEEEGAGAAFQHHQGTDQQAPRKEPAPTHPREIDLIVAEQDLEAQLDQESAR